MDDGGRQCALPGCDQAIATTDGRPERRYCTAAHRAAARQARRAALQTGQRGRPDPLAETLPWLREPAETPADPARPTAEVAPTEVTPIEVTAAEPVPAAARAAASGSRDRRRPPGPRGRALAVLGVAGILAGGYAATETQPEPSPSPVRATPEGETADAWAQRATVALTSVNRELDVLEQADEEWRQLPESRRAVVPPPVTALEERRSVLQRRRTTLQSQLDAYRSLRRAQQELAVSEQQLRAVEKALVDAPPERRRSAEQEAAIAALDEQRDLRLRRRDAQRAELASLQEGVSTATRTPLPDDGEATAKVSQDVREVVRNGGTTPSRSADPSPPRPDVVPGREEEDGKPREEVGTSGPPDPRGPRDESEKRRAGREEPGEQELASGREEAAEPAPGPTAGPEDRPSEAGTGGAPDLRPAPAPPPAEPSAENEGTAEPSQDVLAELRDRAEQVAREARKAEAAREAGRATVARGEAAGKDDGSAAPTGTSRLPERARRDAADRAVEPSPTPRPRQSDAEADQRRPDRDDGERSDQVDAAAVPSGREASESHVDVPARPSTDRDPTKQRPSPRKRGTSEERRDERPHRVSSDDRPARTGFESDSGAARRGERPETTTRGSAEEKAEDDRATSSADPAPARQRPSPRKRDASDQRRSGGKDAPQRDDAEKRRPAEDTKDADDEDAVEEHRAGGGSGRAERDAPVKRSASKKADEEKPASRDSDSDDKDSDDKDSDDKDSDDKDSTSDEESEDEHGSVEKRSQ